MGKIHSLADVQSTNIGQNTNVWQFCVVLKGAVIGDDCNVCANVLIENDVKVGNRVTIKSGVQLWDGLTVEDDVFIGPNVTFTNDLLPRSKQYPEEFARTHIQQGASIGANATILAGNTLGRFCLIGAGSLISKSVPAFQVYYGNPAQHKGYVTRKGTLVSLDLKDKKGNSYKLVNEEPVLR